MVNQTWPTVSGSPTYREIMQGQLAVRMDYSFQCTGIFTKKLKSFYTRFQVCKAVNIHGPIVIFWVMKRCSLVAGYQHFVLTYRLHSHGRTGD
jgi:hypothetical protein